MMHGRGKSDEAIVALKPANKAERSAAEQVERRAEAKGNVCQRSRTGLSTGLGVLSSLVRMRTIASATARLDPRWKPYAGKLHVRICAGGEEQSSSLPRRPYRDPIDEARPFGEAKEGARRLARLAGASPVQVRRSEPPGGECCVSRR